MHSLILILGNHHAFDHLLLVGLPVSLVVRLDQLKHELLAQWSRDVGHLLTGLNHRLRVEVGEDEALSLN